MKKSTKIISGLLISVILILVGFFVISYFFLKSYIPDYDGEVETTSVINDITVYRDSAGVPFIITPEQTDAAFALGILHAQERMFQMDLARRAGEGRLSEIFGSPTVQFDKMFRTLQIEQTVSKFYNLIDPPSKLILQAYAEGVNFYLDENDGKYSIEFDVLGYRPDRWTPQHSLIIAKLMAFELNLSWWSDIAISHLLQKFDAEKVKEIIPDYPENAPTIIPVGLRSAPLVSLDIIKTDRAYRKFMGFVGTHIGSNNWVVNANKSVSGKPIIANDPHLAFQAPGRWFMAGIRSDGWNAEGFTIPGMPAVVIGKNENISWVLTNVMADDADFYFEEFDSTGTKYLLDGTWRDLSIEEVTIHVKDSSDVILQIKSTHRGPVVANSHAYNKLFPNDYQQKANLSMRWTAHEFSNELKGILLINKASNWDEFLAGAKEFTVPGQNFVYADKEGNIGFVCAARLPIRNNVSPTFIYDGTTSENDWKGFVPFEEMPKLFNPGNNYIASANNKTIRNFKYHISNIWEPPSRIDRITEFLESKEKLSTDDYKKLQNDFISHYAMKITPYILNAFSRAQVEEKNLKTALELLEKWNFEMKKESQTPTIFNVFLVKLLDNIFKDQLEEELFNEYVFLANIPYRIIIELFEKGYSSWFDNIDTETVETRDKIIRKSMIDALEFLEIEFGENLAAWQWGELHKVEFKHFFSGVNPVIDKLVNIGPYSIGGDGTTVNNTEYSFTDPYLNKLGPSMRYIYDFSNPYEFEYIMPTGQSGHILSDYYSNMTEDWLEGSYKKLQLDMKSIENFPYKFTIIKK